MEGGEKSVLQFMRYNAPYQGNFIKSLLRLENRLKEENIEMIYLFEKGTSNQKWAQELILRGKKMYFLEGKLVEDLLFIYRITKRHNVGIIHAHFTGLKHLFLFSLLKGMTKKRVVLLNHIHSRHKKKNFFITKFKKISTSVNLHIGCGEAVSDHFKSINRISNEKITYVVNAIEFERLEKYVTIDRESMSLPKESKLFLMFGYDYYIKGVDIAFSALEDVVKNNKNVILLLTLSINKDFVVSKIKEKFGSMPYWIKLLEPRDDIGSYHKLADVFLAPSRTEGLSYSLIEAAYSGLPIIASDIPGQSTLNIPNVFKFPSEDISKLKQQILTVLDLDQEQISKIASAEKSYVMKTFDLNVWAEEIVDIYKSFYSYNHTRARLC